MSLPACPACHADYTWQDGDNLNCPSCGHIWTEGEGDSSNATLEVRDANGNLLADGDSVTVIKDLKVKGMAQALKRGTVVKNIRLTNSPAEIEGRAGGSMLVIKTEFVKKA